jgi:hypothetical protein
MMATNNVPKIYPLSRAMKVLASILGAALIFVAGFFAWMNPTFREDLILATSKQPERYTELSFDKSLVLPTTVTPGQPYSFEYHVTNNEFAQINYEAQVYVSVNGAIEPLETDHFTLTQGDSHDQIIHFLAPKAGTTMQFIVTLPGYNDTIDFRSVS